MFAFHLRNYGFVHRDDFIKWPWNTISFFFQILDLIAEYSILSLKLPIFAWFFLYFFEVRSLPEKHIICEFAWGIG